MTTFLSSRTVVSIFALRYNAWYVLPIRHLRLCQYLQQHAANNVQL